VGAVLGTVRERLTGRNRYRSGLVSSVFAEFRAVTNGILNPVCNICYTREPIKTKENDSTQICLEERLEPYMETGSYINYQLIQLIKLKTTIPFLLFFL
jgi:hypothetical protein